MNRLSACEHCMTSYTRPPCTPRVLLLSEGCDSSTQLHRAKRGMRSSPCNVIRSTGPASAAVMGAHLRKKSSNKEC